MKDNAPSRNRPDIALQRYSCYNEYFPVECHTINHIESHTEMFYYSSSPYKKKDFDG